MNKGSNIVRIPIRMRLLIARWIEDNKDRILEERPSYAEATKWAAEDLKMTLGRSSLKMIFGEMGCDWSWPRNLESKSNTSYPPYGGLCSKVDDIRKDLDRIAKELGIELPSSVGGKDA